MLFFVTTVAIAAMALNVDTYGYPSTPENEFLLRYPVVYIFGESGEKLKRKMVRNRCDLCYVETADGNFSANNYDSEWGTTNCTECLIDLKALDYKKTMNDGRELQCRDFSENFLVCEVLLELLKSKPLLQSIVYKNIPQKLNIFRIH